VSAVRAAVPAVVLGWHHGSLGIARSLGRLGVAVHGVHTDLRATPLSSRYVASATQWEFGRETPAASVRTLLELAERLGERAVLIPTSDDLAIFVAEHADALAPAFRFPRVAAATVRALSDKRELYLLARRLGVPTPETSFPRCREEVTAFAASAVFPVMLKGIDGLRLQARTGLKMCIARDQAGLMAAYDRMEDPAAPNLMLQEYVPGGDDTIWMFNGYFDDRSQCRAAFTGKKLRQHPVHTGSTSLGICLENPEVERLTVDFMRAIGYRGILDVGWRYDARDGGYKLLDPNPRIGSTFRLFLDAAGMDVVRYLYADLTDQPLPPAVQREGRKWMVEDRDLESALDYLREGTLSAGRWLRSFQGVEESAWFARDDLRPFFLTLRSTAARGLGSLARKLLPRPHARHEREAHREPRPVIAAAGELP
jgi:predicted ATP-grasp superfamily ATP-dependent carboligase